VSAGSSGHLMHDDAAHLDLKGKPTAGTPIGDQLAGE
jgi:hypothetical protein